MERNESSKHLELQGQQFAKFASEQNTNTGIIQIGNIMPTKNRANPNQGRVYSVCGIAPCLTNLTGGGNRIPLIMEDIRLRKLTPKECFRLQGWSDDYFEKAEFVNTDSQLYKQAGNGVTVTVIEAIAKELK